MLYVYWRRMQGKYCFLDSTAAQVVAALSILKKKSFDVKQSFDVIKAGPTSDKTTLKKKCSLVL